MKKEKQEENSGRGTHQERIARSAPGSPTATNEKEKETEKEDEQRDERRKRSTKGEKTSSEGVGE